MESFKRFGEEKLPDKKMFLQLCKKWNTSDNSKKLDGQKSDDHYLTCKKIWNKFNMKNMGDYHGHYLKKMFYYQLFLKSLLTCA